MTPSASTFHFSKFLNFTVDLQPAMEPPGARLAVTNESLSSGISRDFDRSPERASSISVKRCTLNVVLHPSRVALNLCEKLRFRSRQSSCYLSSLALDFSSSISTISTFLDIDPAFDNKQVITFNCGSHRTPKHRKSLAPKAMLLIALRVE